MRVPGGPNPIRKRGGKTLRQAIVHRTIKLEIMSEVLAKVREADRITIQDAVNIAREFSSGSWSLAALARKPFPNHPYAVARPNPAFDFGMINRQSGKFYAGWKIKPTGPNDPPAIWNTARAGKFLEFGTRRMVARPIDKKIIDALAPIRQRNLDRIFSRAAQAALTSRAAS